ncbi:hypothetical protein MIT9_P0070 [Methylomarinovum caldicuralii]|uniref:Uncharacterized protein n=1 Tax=Methylomarinovum caldicuralii TaxID=438856 RepID=A0AAU9CRJ3_9GAMM|nr:hypothetical protein MIT9_P0070 [Methylomarinovum caldicuralii]
MTAEAPRPQFQEPDYEAVTLTELSGYLGYLAGLPPLQRRDECRWLHDFVTEAPSLGGRLHLALALLVTPDCLAEQDELRVALELLDEAGKQVRPADLRAFLAYQRLIAQRLFSSRRHEREWSRKLARLRRYCRQQGQRLQRCQTTLSQCQSKLEALKALEKSLNHHGVP